MTAADLICMQLGMLSAEKRAPLTTILAIVYAIYMRYSSVDAAVNASR